MGGVPKQRHTKSRRNKRRSHHALTPIVLTKCPKCRADILPHHACLSCGVYAGREVIDVFARTDKKERKAREKETAKKTEGK